MVMISIEGLPGTKKQLILSALTSKLDLKIHPSFDPEWHQLFVSNPSKYALSYELNRLITLHHQYEDKTQIFESAHALKKVYVDFFMQKGYLDQKEYELFMKYYHELYQQPEIIIYFYGTYEPIFENSQNNAVINNLTIYSPEDFKALYYKYEWVFDINNCFIPIYKVNIDDSLDHIVNNIEIIFDHIHKKFGSS